MSRPPLTHSNSPRFRPTRAKEFVSIAQEGMPSVPRHLTPPERQRFKQMCKQLAERKTLTKDLGELIAIYCKTRSRWLHAIADVEKRGPVIAFQVRDKHEGQLLDREKPNPYLAIAEAAEKTMIACLDRLGFTPLNREHVKPVGKDTTTPEPAKEGSARWWVEKFDREEKEAAEAKKDVN